LIFSIQVDTLDHLTDDIYARLMTQLTVSKH